MFLAKPPSGSAPCGRFLAMAWRGKPLTLYPVLSLVAALPPENTGEQERQRRELLELFASHSLESGDAVPPSAAALRCAAPFLRAGATQADFDGALALRARPDRTQVTIVGEVGDRGSKSGGVAARGSKSGGITSPAASPENPAAGEVSPAVLTCTTRTPAGSAGAG